MPYQSQDPRRRRRKKKKSSSSPLLILLIAVMALLILLAVLLRTVAKGPAPRENPPQATAAQLTETPTEAPEETEAPERLSLWSRLFGKKETREETEPTQPEPVHEIGSATILATGDILMHKPVFNSCLQSDGRYDFDPIFRYITPYVLSADCAAANLETTLCGTDTGYPYSGYPAFNCPDEIVDGLRNAGFDLLLTANNHCYDTGETGFRRTVQTVRGKGLEALGTMAAPTDSKYTIRELNGIKIGMLCYTYEGQPENPTPGVIYMNKNAMMPGAEALINSFLAADPEPFYREISGLLTQMKAEGAEATVLFIHWGTEYITSPSGEQRDMAQRLADLGIDVIVGGHPHVVGPVDLLTSRADPEHRTLCLYSMGNAVSNQRIAEMDLKTGHTEDGMLFSVTFSKYSDGTVYLDGTELIPCWVDLRTGDTAEYDIIPLEDSRRSRWKEDFDLTDESYDHAVSSYDRTMDIVGSGLSRAQQFLADRKQAREENYLAALSAPDEAA